jgi:hypothetical protein
MISRFLEKKILNFANLKGSKFKIEKLFLKSLKVLSKQNKNKIKIFLYCSIKYLLTILKLQKFKETQNKKYKSKKKPLFIFSKKTRIFYAIKTVFKIVKKTKIPALTVFKQQLINITVNKENNFFLNDKLIEQKKAISNKNLFTFYRW